WLKEQGYEYTTPGTKQEPILPSGSAILYDIYCHPDGRNSQKEFIKTVVNEVSSTGNANSTYVIVDARDAALCRILEEVGFRDYEAAIAA
ncbi:MAG TPA: hypothetical protein VN958_07295, partial [Chitinophagaceae bacterium]|nr:hypothetical protein [Chitinophagaceae bacterium]